MTRESLDPLASRLTREELLTRLLRAIRQAALEDRSLAEMKAREAYFDRVWEVLMQMICPVGRAAVPRAG